MTRQLSEEIRPRSRYLRSANVEQHAAFGVDDYIPTGRALEVLHRLTRTLAPGPAGRAWSLTGPYGSGKSSFALFLHALFGPAADPRHRDAAATLASVDAHLAEQLADARLRFDTEQAGFVRALATAQPEPAVDTLLRALAAAVADYWPTRAPRTVTQAQKYAARDRTPRSLSLLLEAVADHAPVVIVLDEFGKNLEHFAADPTAGDLYVLQEMAERCSAGAGRHPALLLTLQHLAFDDYVRSATATQRREWGKVQGRFEDITFLDSADQTLRLIPAAFDSQQTSPAFRRRRDAWAAEHLQRCTDLGLRRLLPETDGLIADCYPLHPLTLLALPDLCSRFGQHGRTLFAFLAGHEPHSVGDFLDHPVPPRSGPLPVVDLAQLYDFFAVAGLSASSGHTNRWLEIDTVLREATGLNLDEQRALKTIGVINLLSQGGPLRAHPQLIAYALNIAGAGQPELGSILQGLTQRGLITYRGFADEYRLWQGSDLDLAQTVSDERDSLNDRSPALLLTARHRLPPAIASRHTQRVGMIRYFSTVFADARSAALQSAEAGADGLIVHWIDDPEAAGSLRVNPVDSARNLPVVIATTAAHRAIREALIELTAVEQAVDRADIQADRVALRELQERATQARRRLDELLARHLRPGATDSAYHLARPAGRKSGESLKLELLPPTRSLSGLLSDVCDTAYRDSPEIRNEMLGRRQLTSQAARARRDLLEAMTTAPHSHRHGLTGYGPEVAMYEAVLAHNGLHRPVDPAKPEGEWRFTDPWPKSTFTLAWGQLKILLGQATNEPVSLDRAYAILQAPPIGLKEGPIPLLVASLLLQHSDTVAVYQEGSYQPHLGAATLERLVKSPGRFTIKNFDPTNDRAEVLTALSTVARLAGPRRHRSESRNNTLLDVAAPLIAAAAALPVYTRKTAQLISRTINVRDALLTAREPDELLFTALPQACDLAAFRPGERGRRADVTLFAQRLTDALDELQGAYTELLTRSAQHLAADFGVELNTLADLGTLRGRLRNTAGPLVDVELIDRRLRAFVIAACDSRDDNQAWLENILSLVAGMPAASWDDRDTARYRVGARELGQQLRRLVALHAVAGAEGKDDGFDAHRIALTRADGHERAQVVWVDHRSQPDLERIIDTALGDATQLLGALGSEALLAVLAEHVLSDGPDKINQLTDRSRHDRQETQARA